MGAVLLVAKRRTATAFIVTVFLMATLAQRGAVEANPGISGIFRDPTIHIDSPNFGKIYLETSIPIEVDIISYGSNRKFVDIYYSLDEGSNITLGITTYETSTAISGIGTLDNLTNGYHTLEAYSTDTQGNTISDSTTFQVYTTPPEITNLSINNTDSDDRLLSFTVDEKATWVGYSLDNKANVTVTGDVVLKDLPFGSHNVTLYAEDAVGNMGRSATLFFTIEEPFPPFPTTMVIAPITSVAVVGTGLLVYFKRRKH